MQLFVQRGFDHVTVAEVAAAAGVSEKTVFNYFPTKEDLFYDEVPAREAMLVETIRRREPGDSIVSALRRLQIGECPRLCSPGFATFARIIEESPALQAKELEIMARYTDALAGAIETELGAHPLDAKIAANVLVGVHWELFRKARRQALAGRRGPRDGRSRSRLVRARAGRDPVRPDERAPRGPRDHAPRRPSRRRREGHRLGRPGRDRGLPPSSPARRPRGRRAAPHRGRLRLDRGRVDRDLRRDDPHLREPRRLRRSVRPRLRLGVRERSDERWRRPADD